MPTKVTGKCGSVTVRLIPAPRGAGIVAARVPKKVLQMAGIEDCYTSARGSTKTLGNFVKVGLAARQCCCTVLQPVRQRGNCVLCCLGSLCALLLQLAPCVLQLASSAAARMRERKRYYGGSNHPSV